MLGVVLILGMIATIAMVSWEAVLPRTQLNSAVRTLASTLHETRSSAIARNAEFEIVYDLNEQKYWVKTPFRPGGGLAAGDDERLIAYERMLPENVQFARITVDGRDFTQDLIAVRFDPLGASSDHTVLLRQEPFGYLYTIEVLALTGLVRFHEGEFDREYPTDGDFQ